MSIKQLPQLETVILSNLVLSTNNVVQHPNGHYLKDNGTVLSNYLFEGSKFNGLENEANSYFLSKGMDGMSLSVLLLQDIWNQMQQLDKLASDKLGSKGYVSPL